MFGRRPDATLVRDLSPIRRFMPFVSPRRNDSLVYFEHEVDVEAALAFAAERSRSRDAARPVTLFHLVLRADRAGAGRAASPEPLHGRRPHLAARRHLDHVQREAAHRGRRADDHGEAPHRPGGGRRRARRRRARRARRGAERAPVDFGPRGRPAAPAAGAADPLRAGLRAPGGRARSAPPGDDRQRPDVLLRVRREPRLGRPRRRLPPPLGVRQLPDLLRDRTGAAGPRRAARRHA